MNIDPSLQSYLDAIDGMLDYTLEKTGETSVKERLISQADVESCLIDEFNNGYIDMPRLVKLTKLAKDACYELERQHSFKVEAIEESDDLK